MIYLHVMMRTENGDIVSSHPSPPFHSYSVFIVRMNTLTCRCSASSKLLSPNLFYNEKCANMALSGLFYHTHGSQVFID